MPDDATIIRLIPKPATVVSGDITEGDWTAALARITDLENRLDALALDDLVDVDTTTFPPEDGDVLRYNIGYPLWEPAEVSTAVESVADTDSIDLTLDGTELSADVIFAGTGSASTVARSDHTHTAVVGDILTGSATGVLSSGTRTLSSTNTSALASGITYDLDAVAIVRCRNNVNSGTLNLLLRIGADGSYPERSRTVQTVGGVPVDQIIHFRGVFTGAGSGLAISWRVQHASGDATDIRDWELWYSARPRR